MQTGRKKLFRSMALSAVLGCMALGLVGCTTTTSDADLKFVNADKGLSMIGEHKSLMGMGEVQKGVWVDPRTESEYQEGHIPGAVNIPYQFVTRDSYLLDDYDKFVVYGDDHNDAKAHAMSKKLMELGHKSVYTLDGGLRAWQQAGYDLETGGESLANVSD